MATERLGFIGLGVMGTPMAGHLAKAGYRVTAFDCDPARVASLAASSATVAAALSPKDVAAASDIVITMLPSGKEVNDVALGGYGIVHGLKPGGLLLDTSSSDPRDTRATAAKLAERGIAMVDAPVSGAEAGAKSAQLVFMVGGEARDVARVRPLLDILGKTHFHLGPTGSGHVMKAINNLVTAVTLMVFYVFALQCVSTVAVVRRETNSWKWPLFQWFYMAVLAWTLAFITFQGGRMLNLG